MNLYLLRHGLAVEPGSPGYARDADRPLLPKGERKLRKTARALVALGLRFDMIFSSPYLRARQTAAIVAEPFELQSKIEFVDALTPGSSPRSTVEMLRHAGRSLENVLLVGHEPHLSSLISLLVGGSTEFSVVMKKGGLCKLSVESLLAGRCASLHWLLTAKQLALMA